MPDTLKIDHIGLTVADLEQSVKFFTEALEWQVFGGNPSYPASYVTDGISKVTLWQVKADAPTGFDRRANIGLHHLAFAVRDMERLESLYERVAGWPGVTVEFAPEPSGKGPKHHFMITEPGGCRLEFAYDPR